MQSIGKTCLFLIFWYSKISKIIKFCPCGCQMCHTIWYCCWLIVDITKSQMSHTIWYCCWLIVDITKSQMSNTIWYYCWLIIFRSESQQTWKRSKKSRSVWIWMNSRIVHRVKCLLLRHFSSVWRTEIPPIWLVLATSVAPHQRHARNRRQGRQEIVLDLEDANLRPVFLVPRRKNVVLIYHVSVTPAEDVLKKVVRGRKNHARKRKLLQKPALEILNRQPKNVPIGWHFKCDGAMVRWCESVRVWETKNN